VQRRFRVTTRDGVTRVDPVHGREVINPVRPSEGQRLGHRPGFKAIVKHVRARYNSVYFIVKGDLTRRCRHRPAAGNVLAGSPGLAAPSSHRSGRGERLDQRLRSRPRPRRSRWLGKHSRHGTDVSECPLFRHLRPTGSALAQKSPRSETEVVPKLVPLAQADVLELVDGETEIAPRITLIPIPRSHARALSVRIRSHGRGRRFRVRQRALKKSCKSPSFLWP
jgi:hypothetical protein